MALGGASILLALLAKGGRVGWMPLTGACLERISRGLFAGLRRLVPGHAIAFRRARDVSVKPDPVLLWPLAILGTLVLLVLAAGPWLLPAAQHLKSEGSYVFYLCAMALVWALQGCTVYFALWMRRQGPASAASTSAVLLVWVLGCVVLARLPGIVPLVLFAVLARMALAHADQSAGRALPVLSPRRTRHGLRGTVPDVALACACIRDGDCRTRAGLCRGTAPVGSGVSGPAVRLHGVARPVRLCCCAGDRATGQRATASLRRKPDPRAGAPADTHALDADAARNKRTDTYVDARGARCGVVDRPQQGGAGDRLRPRTRHARSSAALRAPRHRRRSGGTVPTRASLPCGHAPPLPSAL